MAIKKIVGFLTDIRKTTTTDTNIALVGEIGTKALTYRKETQNYSKSSYPDLLLTVFKGVYPEEFLSIDAVNLSQIFSVHSAVQTYLLANTSATRHSLKIAMDQDIPNITGFNVDKVISLNNEAVGYGLLRFNYPDGSGNNVEISLYFSNSVIETSFPLTSIEIVNPITDLTQLDTDMNGLKDLYLGMDLEAIKDTSEVIVGSSTPTNRSSHLVKIYPGVTGSPIVFPFTIIGYGPLAADYQYIKNKLKDHILSIITDPTDIVKWTNIIAKDLFGDIGYYMVPQYSKVALPQSGNLGTIFSPIVNIGAISTLNTILSNFSQDYINANLEVFSFHYKGMAIIGVPGTGNTVNNKSLMSSAMFPDYTNTETTDVLNYPRMTQRTRDFITFVGNLLLHADGESTDPYPAEYEDKVIGTATFIRATFENIEYFMLKRVI